MQAVEIFENALRITERPMPVPRSGEVLICVAASGMNRADRLQVKGLYPAPKGAGDLPGMEVSGIIETIGPDVSRWKKGDAVCALLPGGGYAQYAIAAADLCLPVPKACTIEQAAALPEATFTVWNNVFVRGKLQMGETLLVHGGTSGIGTMAIQMAVKMGANVLTTTGSADKAQFCKKLGAHAIDRSKTDFTEAFKDTPPDVVLDMAGGATLTRDLALMAPDGRHVSIAYMEAQKAEIDIALVMKKRLVITGSTLRGRALAEQAALARDLEAHIWPHLDAGRIIPIIDRVFPLIEAAKALEYFESGAHTGKIVLKS